jgi:hypothetical protein
MTLSTQNVNVKIFLTPSLDVEMRTKLPAATSNRRHSSRSHDAAAQCVRGRNNFKEHLATSVAKSYTPDYYLWGAMRGAIYKDNHTLLELKEAVANLIRNIPPTELSRVLCKQDKTCRCVSTSTWGAIFSICCNVSSMRNVFVLIYRDSLNILIILDRFTGTFGSLCINKII